MTNLKELEKTLGNKKTKEALSKSLGGGFGNGLKELGDSLRKIFGSASGGNTTSVDKNQITKTQERFEKKRKKMRGISPS